MSMEFHGRQFPCEQASIIPSGPIYGDATYKSCAYEGIGAGHLSLNGDEYLANSFGFSYSNVGRDFGILILFIIGCATINLLLVEQVQWTSGGGSLEFARDLRKWRKTALKDEESDGGLSDKVGVPLELPTEGRDKPMSKGAIPKSKAPFLWRHLNYTVQHAGADKLLLDDVSGFFEPGSLTALVGVSGAGKSTLMNVLTQQAPGHVSGDIKVGAQDVDASIGRDLGFCQQADIHVETATIREAFEFSAILRQVSAVTRANRLAYVDKVLEILGLIELQDAVIQSLSLEQRKRTTIGVELCAKPAVALFLDEPTSGLDSQGALNIVKLLRRLATAGQTIICTIHQADQEQFELFDRVLALGRGGRPYYFGDIGLHEQTVIEYFAKHGITYEPGRNVAEFLIEVMAGKSAKQLDLTTVWKESPEAQTILLNIDQLMTSDLSSDDEKSSEDKSSRNVAYASSMALQIFELTKRTLTQYWRTPDYIYSRLYCSFFHSALNGLAFLQLNNSVASIQYRIFSCFLVLMIVPEFINASSIMFVENRNIWLVREYPSRVYGWVAFTSAQIIAEIPWALVGGVIFYVLFYFLVGLPLGTPAGYTFLMMMMFHLFSTSWGQWIAALSADAVMAANIMPFIIIVGEFFNGVLQPQSLMPPVWAYTLYYVGPFMYWISGVVAMSLRDLTIQCMDSELIRFQVPPGETCATYAQSWLDGTTGYLANPNATSDCGYCKYSKGEDYLATRQISVSDTWRNLGIFALFCGTNYLSVYLWVYVKSVKNWLPW